MLDRDEDDDLDQTLFIQANDWLLDLEVDPTVFRGISLGKLLGAEATMCLVSYHRLYRALEGLIKRFDPKEIHFFDLQNEINVLLRVETVHSVAANPGIVFIDRLKGCDEQRLVSSIADRPLS